MTPFVRLQPTLANAMAFRNKLLAAPYEYFEGLYGRPVRTLPEKLLAIEECVQRMSSTASYENDTYVVLKVGEPPFIHLIVHRHDWEACKDWRHFQQIKNEIVGPEYEGVELFPAESRLVDTSNVFHLWVHCNPAFRFPMGVQNRLVSSESFGIEKQRAFA